MTNDRVKCNRVLMKRVWEPCDAFRSATRRHFARAPTTTYVPRPTHDERRDDDPDAAMLALRRRTTGEQQRVALDDDDATTGSQS